MTTTSRRNRKGNSIIEFALVLTMLVPLLAGTFTIGLSLAKYIQANNVARDAAVLMVRAVTDPNSGLDLSQAQNQKMIVRAAAGLGLALDSTYTPDPNGKAAVLLSKVILVGDTECAAGINPPPHNAPPWNAGNCVNYGSYVFGYRVVIGNGTRWPGTLGTPPPATVSSSGTVTVSDIATNPAVRASNFGTGGILTLNPSTFALVSEMYVDVSSLNLFSILRNPVLYARSIS